MTTRSGVGIPSISRRRKQVLVTFPLVMPQLCLVELRKKVETSSFSGWALHNKWRLLKIIYLRIHLECCLISHQSPLCLSLFFSNVVFFFSFFFLLYDLASTWGNTPIWPGDINRSISSRMLPWGEGTWTFPLRILRTHGF